MSSTTVLSAMVITCLVIVVLVALAKPLQGLFRFLLSGILGSALLFLLSRLGFAVGVNAVTFGNRAVGDAGGGRSCGAEPFSLRKCRFL